MGRNGIPFRISNKLHNKFKVMKDNFQIKTGKQISMVKISEMVADKINDDPFTIDTTPFKLKKGRGFPF